MDDLAYLAESNIDRNSVALELSRIFSQMVFINGFFHAVGFFLPSCFFAPVDSYELFRILIQVVIPFILPEFYLKDLVSGNLLIRPSPPNSKSPYNFEIVLLDHGLYFDLDQDLRINYANLWLSLIASASPTVNEARRKYAQLAGNIGPELVSCSFIYIA